MPSLNKQQVLDLAQGGYIRQAEPDLAGGQSGLGKTHVATGLAVAACRQGCQVRFYNAPASSMTCSKPRTSTGCPLLTGALKQHLIVLDELGFIPFDPPGAHLIFQFCSALYERVSVIVTTNLRFADWTQIFQDEHLYRSAARSPDTPRNRAGVCR